MAMGRPLEPPNLSEPWRTHLEIHGPFSEYVPLVRRAKIVLLNSPINRLDGNLDCLAHR